MRYARRNGAANAIVSQAGRPEGAATALTVRTRPRAAASLFDSDRSGGGFDLIRWQGLGGYEDQSTASAVSHASVCTTISTPSAPESHDVRLTFEAFSTRRSW